MNLQKNNIVFLFLIFLLKISGQNLESYSYSFEYSLFNSDTICTNFYLINEKDTINQIDLYGNKQGIWVEPFITFEKKEILYKVNKYFDKNQTLNNNNLSFKIDSTKVALNYFYINYTFEQITFYEDQTCNDIFLLNNIRNNYNKNGYYIEEYWFGYLFGNYANNIRKGEWKFLPKIINQNFNKIVNFSISNQNLYFDNISKFINIPVIEGYQIGKYLDNKREDIWSSYRTFNNFPNNLKYISFNNNNLKFIYEIDSFSNIDTIYEIKIIQGKKFIINSKNKDIKIDISYLPYNLKLIGGERNYFTNYFTNYFIKD